MLRIDSRRACRPHSWRYRGRGSCRSVDAAAPADLFSLWTAPRRTADSSAGLTPVSFPTSDGLTLNGWFIKPAEAPRFTVVVFNGNAGNRSMRLDLADALAKRGMAVLLFDYRGFGGNPGSPSEEGLRLDARAVHDYLIGRPDVDPTRIVYFGESLGTAVASELAVGAPARRVNPALAVRVDDRGRTASLHMAAGEMAAPRSICDGGPHRRCSITGAGDCRRQEIASCRCPTAAVSTKRPASRRRW